MDTQTLNDFMMNDKKIKKYFKGVMPRNYLPNILEKKSLYCINLSASYDQDGGSHWVLISSISPNFTAYICSYGRPPIHEDIINKLFSLGNMVIYNDFRNQGITSTTCGWHAIWVAAMLSRDHSLLDIMTKFYTNSTYINDNCVLEIISAAHGVRETIPISDWNFIFKNHPGRYKGGRLMEDLYGGVHSRSNKLNEEFQIMDDEENKKTEGKRKQINPQKKKNTEKNTKKVEGREITNKNITKNKKKTTPGNKKQNLNQTIKLIKTKDSDRIISAKVDLMEEIKSYHESENNICPVLSNFEKKIDMFKNPDTIKLIRFLLYLIVKEKRL